MLTLNEHGQYLRGLAVGTRGIDQEDSIMVGVEVGGATDTITLRPNDGPDLLITREQIENNLACRMVVAHFSNPAPWSARSAAHPAIEAIQRLKR